MKYMFFSISFFNELIKSNICINLKNTFSWISSTSLFGTPSRVQSLKMNIYNPLRLINIVLPETQMRYYVYWMVDLQNNLIAWILQYWIDWQLPDDFRHSYRHPSVNICMYVSLKIFQGYPTSIEGKLNEINFFFVCINHINQ